MTYNAVSLFSGAGGMDVGATQAGFEVVAASELDPHACNTYRKNHPTSLMIEGDIDENMDEMQRFSGVDIVFGGPPCQGFSVAGKMDASDPRSRLVFSFCDVVERLKPRAFVMENVKSLGTLSKFENVRLEISKRMHQAGFKMEMHILNAKDFGVPQSRERVFFIGVRQDIQAIRSHHLNEFKEEAVSLRDAIGHLGRAGTVNNPNVTNAKVTLASKPVLRKSPYSGMLFNGQGRPLNPDAWSSTLPASMGGNRTPIVDENHLYDHEPSWVEEHHKNLVSGKAIAEFGEAPKRLRRLTLDEVAILQSFPLSYQFTGPKSRVFSQIGNAVPCKLAAAVFKAVRSNLDKRHVELKHPRQLEFINELEPV